LLKGIEQCDAALNEFPDSEPALKGTIAYNIVFSYFTLCDVQKLAPYLPIAIQSSITGGCVYGAVTSTYYKGMAEMLTADFAAAQHTFVSTLRMMSEQGLQDYPFIGYLYLGLSHLNYQWNRLDEAQQHATKAIKLAEQGSESMSILNGYACMIQVHQAKGDCDQALEYIQKAEKIAKTLSVDNRLKEVDAWQALNHAIKGDIGAAKNWSKVSDHLLKDHYNQLYEFEALVLAQILLADKKFDDARIVLNWILQWAQRYQRHLIAAQVKLMLAKTSHYSDDRAAVLPLVLQSMETLEPVSAEIHFVGHREWLSGYLTELRAQNKHAVFCSKLLAAFGQSTKQDTSSKYKELLTKREWDVVYLIKQGLSNNQIATGLSISLGTVKRHVHNLLEKLAVSKRYEIINRLEL
ncbi:MAG: hypothetical protein HRT35_38940, partial [Algicola sp.]|nr:hypothetical protein [Algicola sp.]